MGQRQGRLYPHWGNLELMFQRQQGSPVGEKKRVRFSSSLKIMLILNRFFIRRVSGNACVHVHSCTDVMGHWTGCLVSIQTALWRCGLVILSCTTHVVRFILDSTKTNSTNTNVRCSCNLIQLWHVCRTLKSHLYTFKNYHYLHYPFFLWR